jgi:hypothetical protein
MALGFLSAFLLVSGCGSSSTGTAAAVNSQPELSIRELTGPSELGFPSGPVNLQYEVAIANRADGPITLRRIEVQSFGGGAYRIPRANFTYSNTIVAGETAQVQFWVRGLAKGGRSVRADEPVTLRLVGYFDSPAGAFQTVVMKDLSQLER